jgi:glycosyltransferase involved in cell wall biosynthesis
MAVGPTARAAAVIIEVDLPWPCLWNGCISFTMWSMPRDFGAEPRVLVVVPAFNEQASVGRTVDELTQTYPSIDVLVVDDGSGDHTAIAARRAGALVCQLPYNLGVGGAMRAGYRYALRHGYDVAVQVDADGQHDPAYLKALVDALKTSDIAVGARFAGEGDYRARGPRRWAMRLLAFTLSRLAHTRMTDVTSGFRAANRTAILVFADHYPAEYLGDTVESLVIAIRSGCRVTQVPVTMRTRAAGQASQTTFRSTVYLARALVALGLALIRKWPTSFESLSEDDL